MGLGVAWVSFGQVVLLGLGWLEFRKGRLVLAAGGFWVGKYLGLAQGLFRAAV